VEDFLTQVASQSPARWRARPLLPRLAEAKAAFNSTLQNFCDEFIADAQQEDLKNSGRAGSSLSHPSSARILVAGMTGSASSFQFPSGGAGAATGSSSGGAAEDAHNRDAAKNQRLATRPATTRPAHKPADT
jgi:hypothetical protein